MDISVTLAAAAAASSELSRDRSAGDLRPVYTGLRPAFKRARVHFNSGAGFHNTQAVVTLSLSKGDGLLKEPLFAL